MAGYSGIADMSSRLCEDLKKALTPDIIKNPESIGMCGPDDHGDMNLGLFLYNVERSADLQRSTMVEIDEKTLGYVPIYLNLYYMMTAYASGEIKYRLLEEEKIIGAVLQYFNDYPIISRDSFDPGSPSSLDIRVNYLSVDSDERSKIWSFPNTAYRFSLFYKVGPLVIDSGRTRETSRVINADFNVGFSTRNKRRTPFGTKGGR